MLLFCHCNNNNLVLAITVLYYYFFSRNLQPLYNSNNNNDDNFVIIVIIITLHNAVIRFTGRVILRGLSMFIIYFIRILRGVVIMMRCTDAFIFAETRACETKEKV